MLGANNARSARDGGKENASSMLTSRVDTEPVGMSKLRDTGSLLPSEFHSIPKREGVIDGISRIEVVPEDEQQSFMTAESFNSSVTSLQQTLKLPCMIENQHYVVTIHENDTQMFATFLKVEDGTKVAKKLGSMWRNPKLEEGVSLEDWYREHLPSVLTRKAPEATPKQPPRRRPPPQPSESEMPMGLAMIAEASVLSTSSSSSDVVKLKADLHSANQTISELSSKLQESNEAFERKLDEWKGRLSVANTSIDASKIEWSHLLLQKETELTNVKATMQQQITTLKDELDAANSLANHFQIQARELQDALKSTQQDLVRLSQEPQTSGRSERPLKRARGENEVWDEAEKVLALSRADVEQARRERDEANERARVKEQEAAEAISKCEKMLLGARERVESLEKELGLLRSMA